MYAEHTVIVVANKKKSTELERFNLCFLSPLWKFLVKNIQKSTIKTSFQLVDLHKLIDK